MTAVQISSVKLLASLPGLARLLWKPSSHVGRSRYPTAGPLPCAARGTMGEERLFPNLCRLAIFESSSLTATALEGLGFLCGTTCKDLKQIFLVCKSVQSLKALEPL